MRWTKEIKLIMEPNNVHKFANSDGFTINSNKKEIKTNFKYLGIALNCKKLEKLLRLINQLKLEQLKKDSKTELEYEQKLSMWFTEITAKVNPQEYLANYAKHKKVLHIYTNLTKDSFLNIMRCNMHNVIDWDVEVTKFGPNYAIKTEVFSKIK